MGMPEYTVTQYAELTGISRTAVQKQIDTGKLKAEKRGNAGWIIFTEEKDSKKRFKDLIDSIFSEIQLLEAIRDMERPLTKEENQAYDFYYKIFEESRDLDFYEEPIEKDNSTPKPS